MHAEALRPHDAVDVHILVVGDRVLLILVLVVKVVIVFLVLVTNGFVGREVSVVIPKF